MGSISDMSDVFPSDIFTEPEPSPDTLANLGPLAALAGTWEGSKGFDVHPAEDGTESDSYSERWIFRPIDAQTNGPQLLYGLVYEQRALRPTKPETFHHQVGHLMWEPATGAIYMTLSIPRAQVAMARGIASSDARSFTLRAAVDDPHAGIVSNPFLDYAFHTTSWEVTFDVRADGSLRYSQTTTLDVHGRESGFAHTDANLLQRVAPPEPNPLALIEG